MNRSFSTFLLLALLPLSFSGCSKDPDDRAIRALIEEMRVTAEQKAFPKTLEPVASDYRDNFNGEKADVERRLNIVFAPFDRLVIKAPIQKIERNGLSAVAWIRTFVMGVTGERKELVFGSPITPKTIQLYLDKRDGRWRVTGSLIER
jgi:hypothetical protein